MWLRRPARPDLQPRGAARPVPSRPVPRLAAESPGEPTGRPRPSWWQRTPPTWRRVGFSALFCSGLAIYLTNKMLIYLKALAPTEAPGAMSDLLSGSFGAQSSWHMTVTATRPACSLPLSRGQVPPCLLTVGSTENKEGSELLFFIRVSSCTPPPGFTHRSSPAGPGSGVGHRHRCRSPAAVREALHRRVCRLPRPLPRWLSVRFCLFF